MIHKMSFYALSIGDTVSYYGNGWRVMAVYEDGDITVKDDLTDEYVTINYDELD